MIYIFEVFFLSILLMGYKGFFNYDFRCILFKCIKISGFFFFFYELIGVYKKLGGEV